MAVERVDYDSDEDYQQALCAEAAQENQARAEWEHQQEQGKKTTPEEFVNELKTAIKRSGMGQVDFAEDWVLAKLKESCVVIDELRKELAHEEDMNAQGRAKELDIDDMIDNFISILEFDQIIAWANLLDVEVNYPPVSEMWPDWQNELAVEVGDEMRKIGEKGK